MRRLPMPKVTEPDEGIVHYSAPANMDQVTLCGLTDWLEITPGVETEETVTCNSCLWIVDHFRRYKPDAP
jgi:hypothetical protein